MQTFQFFLTAVVPAGQVATVDQQDEQLFKALGRAAGRHLDKFRAQELSKTAWAFATVGQQNEQLFHMLARMAGRHLDKFSAQELANTAWAFVTTVQ